MHGSRRPMEKYGVMLIRIFLLLMRRSEYVIGLPSPDSDANPDRAMLRNIS